MKELRFSPSFPFLSSFRLARFFLFKLRKEAMLLPRRLYVTLELQVVGQR